MVHINYNVKTISPILIFNSCSHQVTHLEQASNENPFKETERITRKIFRFLFRLFSSNKFILSFYTGK
jgi:hypothetical protein